MIAVQEITEEDRQMILVALAHLAYERPGWETQIEAISRKLGGEAMLRELRWLRKLVELGQILEGNERAEAAGPFVG